MNRLIFFIAIEKGYIKTVKWIMNVAVRDNFLADTNRTYLGYTPLTYAIVNNRIVIVRWLLACNASRIHDGHDMSPMDWAQKKGFTDIINVLNDYMPNPSMTSKL
jgi:hypothetical protein